MSHVLILDPHETLAGQALLDDPELDVEVCRDRAGLFDSLCIRRPDVVVYVLTDLPSDLAILSLLRRVSASLPIVLVGDPSSLEARRSIQDVRPIYFGVLPLDPCELVNAVRSGLRYRLAS